MRQLETLRQILQPHSDRIVAEARMRDAMALLADALPYVEIMATTYSDAGVLVARIRRLLAENAAAILHEIGNGAR